MEGGAAIGHARFSAVNQPVLIHFSLEFWRASFADRLEEIAYRREPAIWLVDPATG